MKTKKDFTFKDFVDLTKYMSNLKHEAWDIYINNNLKTKEFFETEAKKILKKFEQHIKTL